MGRPSDPCFKPKSPYSSYVEPPIVTTLPPFDLDFFIIPSDNVICPSFSSPSYKFSSNSLSLNFKYIKVADIIIPDSCRRYKLTISGSTEFLISNKSLYFDISSMSDSKVFVAKLSIIDTEGLLNQKTKNFFLSYNCAYYFCPPTTTTTTTSTTFAPGYYCVDSNDGDGYYCVEDDEGYYCVDSDPYFCVRTLAIP